MCPLPSCSPGSRTTAAPCCSVRTSEASARWSPPSRALSPTVFISREKRQDLSLIHILEENIDEAKESSPDQNLTLFRRRLEPMA